jgi:hypothetical protein
VISRRRSRFAFQTEPIKETTRHAHFKQSRFTVRAVNVRVLGQQQNITDFTMAFVLQAAAAYDWTIRSGKDLYFNYSFCKFDE